MKWQERFERASKRGYFSEADMKAARSERYSPFGERVHEMGYRHARNTWPQLYRAVYAFDWNLWHLITRFRDSVAEGVDEEPVYNIVECIRRAKADMQNITAYKLEYQLLTRIEDNIASVKRYGRR